jgi:hypothetical protein
MTEHDRRQTNGAFKESCGAVLIGTSSAGAAAPLGFVAPKAFATPKSRSRPSIRRSAPLRCHAPRELRGKPTTDPIEYAERICVDAP